ncbi:uncharacterized protein N7477_002156 [Penicillium maclennaniae]|uniref:uncharacterized protein n=1 Tax=Penicillium maclennaniae TaxID=1343394 RepID=UPI002542138D|nr:uncharacterized protein N7477_002156 [Penicillium maclennaniae]KAJ5676523.1 hypothetical protein N7477_002156 [Penicillium maclennaniae]
MIVTGPFATMRLVDPGTLVSGAWCTIHGSAGLENPPEMHYALLPWKIQKGPSIPEQSLASWDHCRVLSRYVWASAGPWKAYLVTVLRYCRVRAEFIDGYRMS